MSYFTTREIVIPAGTRLCVPPTASTRWGKDYETVVGIGPDHSAYFSMDIGEALDAGLIVHDSSGVGHSLVKAA